MNTENTTQKISDTELKISQTKTEETIYSKDGLLAEKNSLEEKLKVINELLDECDAQDIKSSAEIYQLKVESGEIIEPLEK